MGIQVHRALLLQHAHALGHLKKLARKKAPHADVLAQQQLVEALRRVIDHQEVDHDWDREHAVDPRPHKKLLPRAAYTRDGLSVMRRACRPLRIAEILGEMCQMHQVTFSREQHAHAAQKLAEAMWKLIQRGLVVRVGKDPNNPYGACLYALKQWASSPETLNE
jgi:hypothetical protein